MLSSRRVLLHGPPDAVVQTGRGTTCVEASFSRECRRGQRRNSWSPNTLIDRLSSLTGGNSLIGAVEYEAGKAEEQVELVGRSRWSDIVTSVVGCLGFASV